MFDSENHLCVLNIPFCDSLMGCTTRPKKSSVGRSPVLLIVFGVSFCFPTISDEFDELALVFALKREH